MDEQNRTKGLDRYLSPVDVWAMAFGVMVGWGVFAMPGNTFLPVAGPAGTLIAMVIGMVSYNRRRLFLHQGSLWP